jgi:hypothetical protein
VRVLKFGGSSLATPATIRAVGRILLDARRREPVIAVVSAFQGVTNQLLECARLAERADGSYEAVFEQIARRHRSAVARLLGSGRPLGRPKGLRDNKVRAKVDALLAELRSTLQGIHLLRHCPPRALDMAAAIDAIATTETDEGDQLSQFAVRGITMTLAPIDQAKNVARDCRGELADISLAQFKQHKVSITCTDHEAPELTDVWPGQDVTITCIPGLGAANGPGDVLTILAKITSWNTSRAEWQAQVAWQLEAEQRTS